MPDFFHTLINLELRLNDSVFKYMFPADIPEQHPAARRAAGLQNKKVLRTAFKPKKQTHPHIPAVATGYKKLSFFRQMIAQKTQNPLLFRDNHLFILNAYQIARLLSFHPKKRKKLTGSSQLLTSLDSISYLENRQFGSSFRQQKTDSQRRPFRL